MTSKRSKYIELNLFVFTCVKCLHRNCTLNALRVWTGLCFSPRAVWSVVARSSERLWLKKNRAKCKRGSFRHYLCWPRLNGTMCYPTCAPTCSASSVIYTLPAAFPAWWTVTDTQYCPRAWFCSHLVWLSVTMNRSESFLSKLSWLHFTAHVMTFPNDH